MDDSRNEWYKGKMSSLIFLIWIFTFLKNVWISSAIKKPTPVLLVVFDGFGSDFLSEANTPNFDKLVENGVTVPFVWNVFPATSLPNHYTLATGLYPSSHGIIGNNVYDSVLNASFTSRTNDSVWFDNAEPIWVTNEKQGFKSGNCYWPGYNVNISGYYPSLNTINYGYEPPVGPENSSVMPFRDRIDVVIEWLPLPDPPTYVVVYFEEPDETSHKFGPHSNQTKQEIIALDNLMGYLLSRLKQKKIHENLNLIVTADHGQIGYNTSFLVNIDQYVNPDLYDFWPMGASSITPMIIPKKGKNFTDVVQKFLEAEKKEEGKMKIFKKSDIPDNLHFKYKNRVGDLLIMMEAPWMFSTSKFSNIMERGTHGYNTSCKSMRPFFIAHGPAFKQGFRGSPIHSVDIYPLICHLLGIQPAPNNGSINRCRELLRESTKSGLHLSLTRIIVGGVLAAAIFVCIGVVIVFKLRKWKADKNQSSGLMLETESFMPLMSDLNYDSS